MKLVLTGFSSKLFHHPLKNFLKPFVCLILGRERPVIFLEILCLFEARIVPLPCKKASYSLKS